MNEKLLEEDRVNRERALLLDSFIVEAPAGAGKTELLTQRYLRLLAVVRQPEEIVAITFTNKAAAEMKNRILESLELAAAGTAPEAAHKRITYALAQQALAAAAAHGWQLLAQPARLAILTIDSLCANLARQMPILSSFGAQPKISADPERHYDEAVRRTLAMLDETPGEAESASASGSASVSSSAIGDALRYLDNDVARASRLLAGMLARRDQWLRHIVNHGPCEEAEAGLMIMVGRDLAQAARGLSGPRQSLLMTAARYAAANLPDDAAMAALAGWSAALSTLPEALPEWRALAELLLTGKNTLRKKLTVNEGFPPGPASEPHKKAVLAALGELSAADAEAIARIRKLPDPRYREEEWRIVEALAKLLKLAAVQLWAVFHEAGEADFVEVAQRALAALGDDESPSDLALALDYRISHLLVDEFQDTSPTQVALLQRLTVGWQPNDGRTLFAVGDPMQSIYRFRKADVGLFLRAAETGIGGIALQRLRLYRNNRSVAAVVDWVNASFARVFPEADSVTRGAIRYRPFVATRAAQPGAGVEVHPLIVPRELPADASDSTDAQEARVILEIIASERAFDPDRRIAVLVRARSHLDALVAAIRRYQPGLRFQALEIEGLAGRQPVQDLLSLTRALLHRGDRVNWLAILRAPWCGLTLADLHVLAADDHNATLWRLIHDEARLDRLSEDGRRRLLHLRAVLLEAYAHQGRARLSRWLEGVWLKLGGAGCLAGPAELADAQAYLDLINELDAARRFSLARLEQDVAALYAAPDALADGSLQFMTIHKSKGLEFDTVILPALQKKGRSDDHELMLWEEVVLEGLAPQLVAAPLRKRGRSGGKNGGLPSPYDYLRLLEQERSGNEDARVLYVAATRAVRSLHLVGSARCNAEGEAIRPAGSFLDLLWESVAGNFAEAAHDHALADDEAAAPDRARGALPTLPRLVRMVNCASPALLARPSVHGLPAPVAKAETEPGEDNSQDASVGTLVHVYLEIIVRSGVAAWTPQRIASLLPMMRRWLAQHGHGAADAAAGALRVERCLNATLASEQGRWVLAARAGAAAELAVTSYERGRIATRVVDRSFVEDGVRWIIDYKTVDLGEDADACRLTAHAERYRPQLESYAALFAAENLPVRLAVLYVAHGILASLEYNPIFD